MDDICLEDAEVTTYYPFFRKEIELWKLSPLCPKFEVTMLVDCRVKSLKCHHVDYHLYKPENSVMLCLSFRLRCAFLYISNTDITGDKVICVEGTDVYGTFSAGFYFGLCRSLVDWKMACSDIDEADMICCGVILNFNQITLAITSWSLLRTMYLELG